MKDRLFIFVLGFVALAPSAFAQTASPPSPLPLPPPVEKELAARASNVTEVTLGKNMLGFAAKFMNGKDEDEAATRQLIEGLDGIYVREYEFDKEGEYSMDEVDKLRKYFETSEWSPIVRERERKSGETTDVMVKMVNGESHGMFILSAEPKELTHRADPRADPHGRLGKLSGHRRIGCAGRRGKRARRIKPRTRIKEKDKKGRQPMRRLWWIPDLLGSALLVPVAVLAGGGAGGFDGVVQTRSRAGITCGPRAFPFLALDQPDSQARPRTAASAAARGGVRRLLRAGGWRRAERHGRAKAGSGMGTDDSRNQPAMAASRRSSSCILEGTRMGLFVLDLEGHELDVVRGFGRSRPSERKHRPVRSSTDDETRRT